MTNHQTGKKTVLDQGKSYVNLSLYPSRKTGKPRKNLTKEQFTTRALEK